MSTKCFPFPEKLLEREVIREDQPSERLKRMTNKESQDWESEALQLSMKEFIDKRIKPTYPLLHSRILSKSIDCDILFDALILGKNGEENTI